jgi:long-subunit acyl-CoA synthetase (AMP-forming)
VWRPTTAEKRDWRSRHTATDRRQIVFRDVTTGSDRHKVNSIRQGYGLIEIGMLGLAVPVGSEKHGSVGKVVSYMSCKIRDPETGKSLGPNQNGEVCFKGSTVMKGYYGNEEATKNAFTFTSDGWLLTGDRRHITTKKNISSSLADRKI